jgi:hypothetical protein
MASVSSPKPSNLRRIQRGSLGAAGVGEAGQLGEAGDRHDAGNDRDVDAPRADFVDEVEVGVGVVEVLGDRRIGAGLDLAHEVRQVVAREARLRVPFGIGGDLEVEVVAGLGADELDEFVGVAELAGFGHARRQVAAQGDDAADAGAPVVVQDVSSGRRRSCTGRRLGHADVGGLLGGQLGELRVELLQLQARDLFVEVLGQRVDADRVVGVAREQLDLGDRLVGERGDIT